MSQGSESKKNTMPNQCKDPQQTETRDGGNRATNSERWNALIPNAKRLQQRDKPYSDINGILHLEATSSLSSAEPAKVKQKNEKTGLTLAPLSPLCQRLHI
jgi:hypothetical protein